MHGPTGCGKTHLAEGIWSATRRTPGKQCVFLAAEQFTTHFLEALHGQGLPALRRKLREIDLLVIDDIQFLHGKKATLQELLNTVEHFAREQKQLVLTADRAPGDVPGLGAELVARLSCGLVADLTPLEESVRRGVLEQLLAQRGRSLPTEVLDLLARELPGDGRQLQGALNRLEAMHEATGRTVTPAFTREALKDLLRAQQKMLRLIDIEQAVCEVFGISAKSLKTEAKARSVTQPRMLAMWLARKHTRAGLTEISQHFGLKSHSTVVAAQKKVSGWMESQAAVGTLQGNCDVQEAVRRVETVLRAV
jgi:chromosomal replication initiator protein